ncbi:MAG: hypothetical protein GY870_03205 [archaeon]|nr:hypothetical protein [archaeon]
MMYMFRVLVLGDTKLSLPFIVNGGVEHVSQDFELSRWTKKLNVGVDQCNLDIDVVVTSSSDFDSLIPTCDGILYFLDPNNLQDFELFDMIANIILEVRREIPIIVVFYTPDGFITIPSNFLFEYIWDFYPFEAFTFNQYSKNTLYEVLECLSEAIIVGSMPINIETAWMRIPFFLNKINNLVVNENWEQAAKLTTIFTQIKKRFEKHDYFINAEQAAWLYYKLGNYLKASALLEGINDIDSKKFRKFYVQDLLHQANSLFKMKRFRNAAEKYEKAALWAKIELDETDSDIAQEALFNAINTWTSACEFQNSFRLLEKIDHTEQLLIMENLGPKIAAAADYLIENKRYDVVKSQLYFCIDKFQRVGLFDSVKILGEKIATVLKIFINNQIEEASPDSANLSLDELFNIWDTFNLERENLDNQIYEISNLFLKKHEFSIIDTLISQVEDLDIKTKISVDRSNAEESFKKSKKDVAQADLNVALEILEKYIKEEVSQFTESNKKVLEYVKSLKSEGQYWDTSLILKQRAQWYKKIGRKDLYNELLTETLETYIEGLLLIPFAQEINNLGNNVRTSYLMRVRGRLANSVEKYFEKKETTEKINNLMENLVRLYRNHLLYEESKELIRLQINFLTMRASERLFNTKGLLEIPTALSLIKQSEMLYGELSEKEHLKNDKIYGEIVKRYIEVEDYSKAARINEKIEDKEIFSVLHSQIQKFEEERSGEQIKDVQKIVNWKIKSEELSILKNHARDQLMTQQSVLKTRNALKRMLYKKLLNALSEKDYKNALELYKNSTISMIKQRKMETAGISYAIVGLLLIKTDSIRKLDMIKKEIDKKIGMSSKIFNETFPVKVIEFAKEMLNFNETSRGYEAIALYENLALFEEEKELLFSIIGKELLEGKPQQISDEYEEISNEI